jgi:hypothetical protein
MRLGQSPQGRSPRRQSCLVPLKGAPEARHTLAQPVRAGLKCKKIVSTVGAAPNQKHISDQTRFRVSSQAGVRGEGLRRPSAGFRREPVVFFRRPFAFPGVCHPEPSCACPR